MRSVGWEWAGRAAEFRLGADVGEGVRRVVVRRRWDGYLVLLAEPGLGKSHAIADAVAELRRAGRAVHLVDLGAYEGGASLVGRDRWQSRVGILPDPVEDSVALMQLLRALPDPQVHRRPLSVYEQAIEGWADHRADFSQRRGPAPARGSPRTPTS